jgi:hypothetical protein
VGVHDAAERSDDLPFREQICISDRMQFESYRAADALQNRSLHVRAYVGEQGMTTWPTNDREWARCNFEECANGKCQATGECQDVPHVAPSRPHDDEVNPKTLTGAKRVDLSLLPPAGVIHGAHAMMDGAEKYGPYNWREKKVPARTYIAAAGRHLADWLDGEEAAADSGVHHLGHVIGCCAIVLDAMETGNLIDDRPTSGAASQILARLEAAILARRKPAA